MDHRNLYWEDRLSDTQYAKVQATLEWYGKKKRKTREDGNKAYDELTNAGLYPEEADEMLNLE